MKKRKIFSGIAMVCMVLIVFAGCGKTSAKGASADNKKQLTASAEMVNGTVRIGSQYEWEDKNPYAEISGGADRNLRIIYEPVFDRDRDTGDLISVLGKSWKEVDPFTYEVELYDYIKDSAGNSIKADDILFSFDTMKKMGNYWVSYLVKSCTKVDEYTFQLTLWTARAGALETVLCKTPIISQASYEANDFSQNPIGSGHYVLTNYVSGSSWTYGVNENYWQTEELAAPFSKANISNIEYKVYKETAQCSIALETGDIDVIEDVAASEFYLFEEGGEDTDMATMREYASHFITFLNYNCNESNVFSNIKLRKAVSTAIDSQVLLDNAYDGHGGVAKTLGASSCADVKDEWLSEDYYDYNPEKAKELLKEAGYAEGELSIRLLVDNFSARVRMAQIIQSSLAEIGVDVEILAYDTASSCIIHINTRWISMICILKHLTVTIM